MDYEPQLGDLLRWDMGPWDPPDPLAGPDSWTRLPDDHTKLHSIVVSIDYLSETVKLIEAPGDIWYETIDTLRCEYTLVQRLANREDHD
jgi:hypothetical protein